MTVGRVSNLNYIAAAGRVNSPAMRPQAQNVPPLAPTGRTAQGTNALFFNLDGDSAELSRRAIGLSTLDPNQRPVGPGIITNYPFNLPSPFFDRGEIGFGTPIVPVGTNLPPGVPQAGTPAGGPQGALMPEIPGSGMLEELEPQGACTTCQNRRYVDQSDDASVSFQTPTKINPSMAAAAVASHEQEHVRNEQARAQREGRDIINQSVTLHYDFCPECGRNYVSGGTTRTTSVSRSDSDDTMDDEMTPDGEMSED